MLSASVEFVLFSLIVVVLYQLVRSALWRKSLILLAACWMLSTLTHDPKSFVPFTLFLALGYVGFRVVKRHPKTLVAWVVGVIVLFMYLKRYSFIPSAAFLSFPTVTVGLSYILFRVLHVIIDAGSGTLEEDINLFDYLVYLLNFTTLVSGPIARYQDFKETLSSAVVSRPSVWEVGGAIERIIVGFFKTNVLALIFSLSQSMALTQLSLARGLNQISGVVAFASYPFFLYCNFSGYIDIVIGITRLLGIKLPENFNRPFSSDSFIEFWNRWHITLSQWLRSYVYNPLLMSLMRNYSSQKLEPVWAVTAFFVTFFLVGAWHGQTAAFLFFGFLQGLGVSMNKLYQILMTAWLGRKPFRTLSSGQIYVIFARGLTFTWFAFTLLWFHSNFVEIGQWFGALGWARCITVWLSIWLAASVILAIWEWLWAALLSVQLQGIPVLHSRYLRTAWGTSLILITAAVVLLSNQPAPDLVYKAF